MSGDERVIDGLLHRRDGEAWVPMTAQELTVRLLEARCGALAGGFPIFVWPAPERGHWDLPPVTCGGAAGGAH